MKESKRIYYRAYRLSFQYFEFVRQKIGSMLEDGIITPVTLVWSFLVVNLTKTNAILSLFMDYRASNRKIKANPWTLPRIETSFVELKGSSIFITMDLFAGY